MFKVTIKTDNAAFKDEFFEELNGWNTREEVVRILKELIKDIEEDLSYGKYLEFKNLRDRNGNCVGKAEFK